MQKDDLFGKHGGQVMPPKTIAGLLLCRVVIICAIGAVSIVAISIFCPHDMNKDTITVLVGFLGASIAGLLSLAKVQESAYELNNKLETHQLDVSNKLAEIADTAKLSVTKAETAATVAGQVAEQTTKTLDIIQHKSAI